MAKKPEPLKSLNADEREIIERLHQSPDNAAEFCVNDFSFGRERFIRAMDNLFHNKFIDTPLCPKGPVSTTHMFFSFEKYITDDDTKIEIIKTDNSLRYIKKLALE